MKHWLDRYGYSLNPVAALLWPLSLLFNLIVRVRRWLYQMEIFKSVVVDIPVIVVGNLSVGGTGKTPLVIRLVELLRKAGYKPGIISRGYGGRAKEWPRHVSVASNPLEVGDEPVLLAQRCGCPVVVDPDRANAARALCARYDCDVLISDDGLQHYRLQRDIEIAVIDGLRRLGNGACLPAGPLREPPARLRTVDFVIGHGAACDGEYLMSLHGDIAVNLADPCVTVALSAFWRTTVHAVAGLGNPGRFFDHLRRARLRFIAHPFPDHHSFRPEDFRFPQDLPILMTEKDAVKCRSFAAENWWFVPVNAQVDPEFEKQLLRRLARIAMTKGVVYAPRRSSAIRRVEPHSFPSSSRLSHHGQKATGDFGVPGQQGPPDLRSDPAGIDLPRESARLSDSRRNPSNARSGSPPPD